MAWKRAERKKLLVGLTCISSALAACTTVPTTHVYEFEVNCLDQSGTALAGVSLRGASAGPFIAGEDGRARFTLTGVEGSSTPVQVTCPEDYETATSSLNLILRTFANPAVPPTYRVVCRSKLRSLIVVVDAKNGPNLPLLHLGERVATTDESGAAHWLAKVRPFQTLELVLDTSSRADLRPQMPSERFSAPENDSWQVVKQSFAVVNRPLRASAKSPIVNLRHRQ